MTIIIIILLIFIIVSLIIAWFINTYNNLQIYVVRINEAENNIDNILRQRFDLLNKMVDIIKAHIETDDKILDVIVNLRSKKVSNFELDRKLYDAIAEFKSYKEKYPTLKESETFMKTDVSLDETEAELTSFKKYYNNIITDYNKLIKSFPISIVAKLHHLKVKTYFEENKKEKIEL